MDSSMEIRTLALNIAESDHSIRVKEGLVSYLNQKLWLHDRFKNTRLWVFGSTLTRFGLEGHSDLDLLLLVDEPHDVKKKRVETTILEKCKEVIFLNPSDASSHKLYYDQLIFARIPLLVLRYDDGSLQFKVEISVSNINVYLHSVGLKNSRLLALYSLADPRVKPLVLVVKKWANFHSLVGTREHRLSHYSMALMMIYYLQKRPTPALPLLQKVFPSEEEFIGDEVTNFCKQYESKNEETLSALLLNFFKFYATEFKFFQVISIRTNVDMTSEHLLGDLNYLWRCRRTFILVEEPITKENATRQVDDFRIWSNIEKTFKRAYRLYKEAKSLGTIYSLPSEEDMQAKFN